MLSSFLTCGAAVKPPRKRRFGKCLSAFPAVKEVQMKTGRIFVVIMAVIIAGIFMLPSPVQARGRFTTFTGPRGRTGSRSVQRGWTSSGYQRNVSTTGPGGNTYTHSSTTTGVGTGNRTTTMTGPAGNTATRNVQQGVSSGGYQRSVTSTGPAGNTASHSTVTTVSK